MNEEDEKRKKRIERFAGELSLTNEKDVLKKRAERFGLGDDQEVLQKRAERFGLSSNSDVLKKRAERFGLVIDNDKLVKRAERFKDQLDNTSEKRGTRIRRIRKGLRSRLGLKRKGLQRAQVVFNRRGRGGKRVNKGIRNIRRGNLTFRRNRRKRM